MIRPFGFAQNDNQCGCSAMGDKKTRKARDCHDPQQPWVSQRRNKAGWSEEFYFARRFLPKRSLPYESNTAYNKVPKVVRRNRRLPHLRGSQRRNKAGWSEEFYFARRFLPKRSLPIIIRLFWLLSPPLAGMLRFARA